MKLVTFSSPARQGAPRLGVLLDDGAVLDVQKAREGSGAPLPAFDSMQALIDAGDAGLEALHRVVTAASAAARVERADARLLAPLPLPIQMRDCLCFEEHLINATDGSNRMSGLSQRSAAQQHRIDLFRKRPFWYKCNRFAVTGTDTDVEWPRYSKVMDYELEMAVIIGRTGRDISREQAGRHIFGYTVFNDFSARDTQVDEMATLGPAKSKDFDRANVLGPCIVTADSFDPRNARMVSRVNGEVRSEGHSSTMYWHFEQLIAFISQHETLHAGEILGSGTVGMGCGLEQGALLRAGDVVELEIEGIGVIRNRVLAPG